MAVIYCKLIFQYNTRMLKIVDLTMYCSHAMMMGRYMRKKGHSIGRLAVVVPRQEGDFYLKTLLTVKRKAKLLKDVYTVDGVNYETLSVTCRALSLVFDYSE